MKIIYMGTPEYAVPPLKALVAAGHEVLLCVTQPDKQKGRGKKVMFPPVKEEALQLGIPVLQPTRIREPEIVEQLRGYAPELIVVAAFGQILSKELLELPEYGCINIHASLLPKYRGASPIQWTIMNGEKKAGVTTMQMAEGIDTGDLLLQKSLVPEPKETYGSLQEKLAQAGAELILQTLQELEAGTLKRVPQAEEAATHTRMLHKEMGKLDFTKPAAQLERLIRGLNPWPSAYTHLHEKTLKVWDAQVCTAQQLGLEETSPKAVGEIVAVRKDGFAVQTGEDYLLFSEVQLEGKKRMDCGAFLRGYPVKAGEKCC